MGPISSEEARHIVGQHPRIGEDRRQPIQLLAAFEHGRIGLVDPVPLGGDQLSLGLLMAQGFDQRILHLAGVGVELDRRFLAEVSKNLERFGAEAVQIAVSTFTSTALVRGGQGLLQLLPGRGVHRGLLLQPRDLLAGRLGRQDLQLLGRRAVLGHRRRG